MNEQFEDLAKTIFDHETQGPDNAAANWDEQDEKCKNRYRTAAITARLITLGPIYRIEPLQPVSK